PHSVQHHLLLSYLEPVVGTSMVARYFSIVDDDTFLHQKVFMTTPMSVNWVNYPKQVAVVSVSLEAYGVRPYRTILGFVVCPRTSDPKLVKITYINYQKEYPTIPDQVEVFSLSSGLWKRLTGKLPRKSIAYMNPQCISKLKESLVVLEKNHASNANVWIMHNGSFTHIFTINTPITWIRDVAGFRKNGEPIIVKKKGLKEKELIVYEPNSKQINYTGIAGPFCYFFASPYTQTLLLLDHKDSVDSETELGTRSGLFRRVGRTLKGVTSSSSATSSSTSYYGASKRYSQEEVNELVKKKSKIIGKRISASFNKKLVNLMTQLAEKGISLDKTPVIGEEDEEYEESDDEAMEDEEYEEMEDVDDGMKLQLDPRKVYVNGGTMAIGHPLGATRARCVATLLHEMKRRGKDSRFGVVSMCIGHVTEDEEDAKTSRPNFPWE
ncbi:putative F-box domain-containing protein, partial [Tanacetum coccineum]